MPMEVPRPRQNARSPSVRYTAAVVLRMLGLALEALELVDSHCRRTLMMLSGDSISEVAAVAVLDANTAQRSWANAGSLSVVL